MKTAIVTGANGFIGSWLLKELASQGVAVTAVIMNEAENVDAIKDLPQVDLAHCDMDHLVDLPRLCARRDFDMFYHLAWAGSSGAARADYALQLTNVRWTVDACHAAKALNCRRFVGAGTLAQFDVNAYSPLDGSTPNAVADYGVAKIAAHYMSKAECCKLGVEHVWAFLSNVYGVGNRTSNFVNFAAKTMLTGQPANFTPATQPYDFVYVSDIAQALYLMGTKGRANHAYYIGSTRSTPLKEFIIQIRDAIDPAIPLNLGAVPFNGVPLPAETFDCSKLVEHTGYQPRVPFEKGIRMTVSWLRDELTEGRL